MSYSFEQLPQLQDIRATIPREQNYNNRKTEISDLTRVWHHSLTGKDLPGSNAIGFANYHISLWGTSVGYALVIEPQNVVDTPNGKRAAIKFCNDIDLMTFHVGSSNDRAVGICVAGDYRVDDLDDPTNASIAELHAALIEDNIGDDDKSHHEMPGYEWKQCCVFDYNEAFKFLDNPPKSELPDEYVVQQGDTLWGLAHGEERFTVEDLMRWNSINDPRKLQIGQRLNLTGPSNDEGTDPSGSMVLWRGEIQNVSWINVRKGPGMSYPTVTQFRVGTEITVYKEQNGWVYIGNGNWVSNVEGRYVKKVTNNPSNIIGKRAEAIVEAVNFYDSPRWNNPSGHFVKGEGWTIVAHITTDGSPQLKVKNSKGHIYYITARRDLITIK
ncbi:LysM peptidoglycan-binding domain-containing protein [Halalkalibacillus halophilus]|uniref:LysM peptidoglycan-binding domain-containing protein n=1 Tax=Halalkalibacillus halophilus TaxID=392827 RepID=UPI000417F36B|nr:LysM peptidoglycan-binding domain-containing protein [Halalkalibacillus halophilus]